MASSAEWNAKLRESYVLLSDEWQAFVGRRIKDDLRLLQQLASAGSPEAMWSVCAKFWQKEVEDYCHEYITMARLTSGLISSGMPQTSEETADAKPSLSNAA